MKRRIARKIDNYKVMPQRLTNKAITAPATSWTSGDVSSSTHAPIPEGASNTDTATMRGTMNSAGCTQSVTLNAKERQEDDQQKHFHQMWSMFETSW